MFTMGFSVLEHYPRYLMAPLQYGLIKLADDMNIKVLSLLPVISFCTSQFEVPTHCPRTADQYPSNKKPP